MPDFTKPLEDIEKEWSSCVACELGPRRLSENIPLMSGMGRPGGILVIAPTPTEVDEVAKSMYEEDVLRILREQMDSRGIGHVYYTYLLACRSASHAVDAKGLPRLRRGAPVWNQEPLKPSNVAACLPRVHEIIYRVDPVVILLLGNAVAEAFGVKHNLTAGHAVVTVSIPGAGYTPVLTEKRQLWLRHKGEEVSAPVARNDVYYTAICTYDPAYIAAKAHDQHPNSPSMRFVASLRAAVSLFEERHLQVFNAPYRR